MRRSAWTAVGPSAGPRGSPMPPARPTRTLLPGRLGLRASSSSTARDRGRSRPEQAHRARAGPRARVPSARGHRGSIRAGQIRGHAAVRVLISRLEDARGRESSSGAYLVGTLPARGRARTTASPHASRVSARAIVDHDTEATRASHAVGRGKPFTRPWRSRTAWRMSTAEAGGVELVHNVYRRGLGRLRTPLRHGAAVGAAQRGSQWSALSRTLKHWPRRSRTNQVSPSRAASMPRVRA